jgi:hypothetical protein
MDDAIYGSLKPNAYARFKQGASGAKLVKTFVPMPLYNLKTADYLQQARTFKDSKP